MNLETLQPMDVRKVDKRIVDLISEGFVWNGEIFPNQKRALSKLGRCVRRRVPRRPVYPGAARNYSQSQQDFALCKIRSLGNRRLEPGWLFRPLRLWPDRRSFVVVRT